MDAPDLPHLVYAEVLDDLASVNRLTMSYRPTLDFLARAVGQHGRFRLLDVGFGQGDMLREIARWADRRGIEVDLLGIDLNPGSVLAASAATPPGLPIRWITGDYADLRGGGFDFIVSSLVCHHMTEAEIIRFLAFMEAEARIGWLVNDLHRHRLAYMGFPFLARVMGWHRIVREDGQLSIARAFRPAEWHHLLARAGTVEAKVVPHFPYRLCVERRR